MSKKITAFTTKNIPDILTKIQEILGKVANEYGLESIHVSRSPSWDETQFNTKITVKVKSENNPAVDKKNESMSKLLGFNQNIVGKTVLVKRTASAKEEKFIITDINLKKPKFPIIAKNVSDNSGVGIQADKRLVFEDKSVTFTNADDLPYNP